MKDSKMLSCTNYFWGKIEKWHYLRYFHLISLHIRENEFRTPPRLSSPSHQDKHVDPNRNNPAKPSSTTVHPLIQAQRNTVSFKWFIIQVLRIICTSRDENTGKSIPHRKCKLILLALPAYRLVKGLQINLHKIVFFLIKNKFLNINFE